MRVSFAGDLRKQPNDVHGAAEPVIDAVARAHASSQNNPRFAGQNLTANADRFAPLMQLARELSLTPAQLALAWLLHQGPDVFPIPGTRRADRIDENARSAAVHLDAELLRRIDALAVPGLAEGSTLV